MDKFVFFGLQSFLYKMNKRFHHDFFGLDEDVAVSEFSESYTKFFGHPNETLFGRVRALHQLGYLPLRFNALAEGTVVGHGIPCFTIQNTHPDFFWLTNWAETWLSSETWDLGTAATTAWYYKKNFVAAAERTGGPSFMPDFQGHNFSMRGMPGIEAAMMVDAGHRLSFFGTDTCPTDQWIEEYYGGSPEGTMMGKSVPATEHSVMCAGGKENILETVRRLIRTYPTGILSIVWDTWDFWGDVDTLLPILKDEIMARDGKIVIRPDSSPKTPVEIICGDPEAKEGTSEHKGLIQRLYEIFGGTKNDKGFIELDPHIGAIYGDSITLIFQAQILSSLETQGFASTNIVLGMGSFTYQYVTRDTHGIAIKATAVAFDWKNGEPSVIVPIFKDPKTDNSGKKSAKGLLQVHKDQSGKYVLHQFDDWESYDLESKNDLLSTVYFDGHIPNPLTFADVRNVLGAHS